MIKKFLFNYLPVETRQALKGYIGNYHNRANSPFHNQQSKWLMDDTLTKYSVKSLLKVYM